MKALLLVSLLAVGLAVRSTLQGQTIIAPGGIGDSGTAAPVYFPMRYQQVFQASDFLSAMPQGGLISQLAFRVEPAVAVADVLSIRIDLSTTQKSVNNLSLVFAENVGANNTTVFGPSHTLLSGAAGEFAFAFQFATPFFYDPRAGNLLLDARNYLGAVVPEFYGIGISEVTGGSSSRIINSDVNASVATFVDSIGAVTQFTFAPVPEPPSMRIGLAMLLVALGCFVSKKSTKLRFL